MNVFYADTSVINKVNIEKNLQLLPENRRKKVLQYKYEIDRRLSICSYLLLLKALKDEYNIYYKSDFIISNHGKPFLKDYPNIYFNLSHCKEGAVCVLSDKPIGIDICDIKDYSDAVAKRIMSTDEYVKLNESMSPNQCFAKIWSRKEAKLKKLGTGLIKDLNSVDTNTPDFTTTVIDNCAISVCGEGSGAIDIIHVNLINF